MLGVELAHSAVGSVVRRPYEVDAMDEVRRTTRRALAGLWGNPRSDDPSARLVRNNGLTSAPAHGLHDSGMRSDNCVPVGGCLRSLHSPDDNGSRRSPAPSLGRHSSEARWPSRVPLSDRRADTAQRAAAASGSRTTAIVRHRLVGRSGRQPRAIGRHLPSPSWTPLIRMTTRPRSSFSLMGVSIWHRLTRNMDDLWWSSENSHDESINKVA